MRPFTRAFAAAAALALAATAGCGGEGERDAPTAPLTGRADTDGGSGGGGATVDPEAADQRAAGDAALEPQTPPNRRPAETEGRDQAPSGRSRAYDAAMIAGEAALYSGRHEAARIAYLRAMELRPGSMSPALGALRAMAIEGHAEARSSIAARIDQKIDAYAARPETQGAANLLRARVALAVGHTGEALDEARLAVQHLPELGVAWRVLGEASMAAELWSDAVDALQTALALGLQAESGTWERLADAYDELGEVDAAEEAARQALAMTGKDPNARRRRYNLLAVVLKHAGDVDGAAAAAERARALGPDDPAVLHNLGALAEAQGRPEQALARYRQAVADTPVPMTLWRLGKLLLELDRPNEALKAFSRAAAHMDRWTWPTSTRWLPAYEVGKLYARANHHDDAVGWFEDALREARTAPATREIVSWLAYTKTNLGDADRR